MATETKTKKEKKEPKKKKYSYREKQKAIMEISKAVNRGITRRNLMDLALGRVQIQD